MRVLNIAVIFAGGTGVRMNSKDDKPKQFLEVRGKPIIVYTIEIFERAEQIDAIIVVCVDGWIDYMHKLVYKYRLDKVKAIVVGGESGQESIYHGLVTAKEKFGLIENGRKNIVLIHDGVRPLINENIIDLNIKSVIQYGSAITASIAKETFVLVDDNESVESIPSRKHSRIAKAPQSFYLCDILEIHEKARKSGIYNAIDSCTLMSMFDQKLAIVEGPYENIKITTPDDFYMFRALCDARENQQLGVEYEVK